MDRSHALLQFLDVAFDPVEAMVRLFFSLGDSPIDVIEAPTRVLGRFRYAPVDVADSFVERAKRSVSASSGGAIVCMKAA
jgi:hypothetical protein